jgi:hypothetical protein
MRLDDGGVGDQMFEVRIIGHCLENPPQTPLMLHRGKRRNTLFQSPNASGRSRQGETAGAPIVANVLDRSFKEVAPDCRLHLMFGPLRAGSMLNVTTVVYLFFGAQSAGQ